MNSTLKNTLIISSICVAVLASTFASVPYLERLNNARMRHNKNIEAYESAKLKAAQIKAEEERQLQHQKDLQRSQLVPPLYFCSNDKVPMDRYTINYSSKIVSVFTNSLVIYVKGEFVKYGGNSHIMDSSEDNWSDRYFIILNHTNQNTFASGDNFLPVKCIKVGMTDLNFGDKYKKRVSVFKCIN